MTSDNPVITIDGPAASGKGTLAKSLSLELSFHLLDSGLLYRIVGLAATWADIDVADKAALTSFVNERLVFRINEEPATELDPDRYEVYLFKAVGIEDIVRINDRNVNLELRHGNAGVTASVVAAESVVRRALIPIQRAMAQSPGLIADGRDMGTVVFPDAPMKFYLDGSDKERAQRRFAEQLVSNPSASFNQTHDELVLRDQRDRERGIAPLVIADDAFVIDTTDLSIDGVFGCARDEIRRRLGI
ncbi:MAG: (d)CMP kinase [Gammaproteobacteria bacterium]|nr:(d)CMP kinase [Gammaproteobacteria bacterium]